MAMILYWEPAHVNATALDLDKFTELKHALRRYKGDSRLLLDIVLNEEDIPVLKGMMYAGLTDAKELIALIIDMKTIRVFEAH